MTPAARWSATIAILDQVLAGTPAEKALLNWSRGSRYAGSGDRAAVRDQVFAGVRCLRSCAARGGAMTGRGLVLGSLPLADAEGLFTGAGHAPAPLTAGERAHLATEPKMSEAEALDCPDWLAPALQASLGAGFAPVMQVLQSRAPVFLRVNLARATCEAAIAALASDGIAAEPHPLAASALQVTRNARTLQASAAYLGGLVELQDAASQAVVQALPLRVGMRVLDYCAGGGGKALAMAAAGARVWAHDGDPRRMRDLPTRAARAGVEIPLLATAALPAAGRFDLVLLDVPCSGSGSWRRAPEGKWALTPERLADLLGTQAAILDRAAPLVAPGGTLAYATCSLLDAENGLQMAGFLGRTPGWQRRGDLRLTPLDGGDGFYCARVARD